MPTHCAMAPNYWGAVDGESEGGVRRGKPGQTPAAEHSINSDSSVGRDGMAAVEVIMQALWDLRQATAGG